MGSICTFECSGRSGLTMWRTKRSDFELRLYCLGLYFSAHTSQSDGELLLLLGIRHLNFPTNSRTNTTIPASSVHTQKHFYTTGDHHRAGCGLSSTSGDSHPFLGHWTSFQHHHSSIPVEIYRIQAHTHASTHSSMLASMHICMAAHMAPRCA